MLFRRRSKSAAPGARGGGYSLRPLLHVLGPDQRPKDFKDPIEHSFEDEDVVISRAELDLRRAVQRLMVNTGATVSSLEMLAAMQLPGNTAALFWAARLLLKESLVGDLYADNQVRRTNHDARLLYRAISQVDLDPWYETTVAKAPITALPVGLQFLPGHPIPGRYYRQHPLPQRSQVYLPVTSYFTDLFYERRQELVRLLVNLGATRIQFENLAMAHPSAPEVLTYGGYPWQPALGISAADYPWLPQEPYWQRLVSDRLTYQSPTATLLLTLDINSLIATQVSALKTLMAQLDSVKEVYSEVVDREYLQPQRVTVAFGA